MPDSRSQWEERLAEESAFWEEWLATKGGRYGADYQALFDTGRTLAPQYRRYLPQELKGTVRLLDVGSGPISAFAVQLPDAILEVTAVDPLAATYNRVLDRHGIVPPIRTEWGEAEKLTVRFHPDTFDLVHASNCIDHCYSPVEALAEMLTVAKPGTFVMLEHAANEGAFQNYHGLHQWNFDIQDGRFVIWSPTTQIDIASHFGSAVEVSHRLHAGVRPWVSVTLQKHSKGSPRPPAKVVKVHDVETVASAQLHVEPASTEQHVTVPSQGSSVVTGSREGLPQHSKLTYSLWGEDMVLGYLLGDKRDGFYVDVGCYHPSLSSNTKLLHDRGWRGVNIDPNPFMLEQMRQQRPGDVCLHLAVADVGGVEIDYLIFNDWGSSNTVSAEFAAQISANQHVEVTKRLRVRCETLSTIFENHCRDRQVDFLNIDVESLDLKVLQGFDWKRWRPSLVAIEDLHFDYAQPQVSGIFTLLTGAGYTLLSRNVYTSIFGSRESGISL